VLLFVFHYNYGHVFQIKRDIETSPERRIQRSPLQLLRGSEEHHELPGSFSVSHQDTAKEWQNSSKLAINISPQYDNGNNGINQSKGLE